MNLHNPVQAGVPHTGNGQVVPAELSRLVMIATSAWELPANSGGTTQERAGSPQFGHRELLRVLLSRELPGRAWLGWDDRDAVDYLEHDTDDVEALADDIATKVRTTCDQVRSRIDHSRTSHGRRLARLRHRVVMDPARLRAVTRPDGVPDDDIADDGDFVHLVCLDLRFDFHRDTPLCYLSLSMWSARPWHDRYVPRTWPRDHEKKTIPVAELGDHVTRCHALLFRTIRLLKVHLTEADRRIHDKHVLPLFWVPVPATPAGDAVEYATTHQHLRRELARVLLGLGDPADCVANASVINGQFDVLRRFRHGVRQDDRRPEDKYRSLSMAHYVIIPSLPAGAVLGTEFPQLIPSFAAQENQTAEVVTTLTNLEARRLGSLHAIHRDLLIWRNHLDVYDQVVERGTFLWDALSAHLMTRRRALRKVHHTVELLHQILLQAVGDLANLSSRTRDCVARINEAAAELNAEYDKELTERHNGGVAGLRGELARTGLFEQVKQHGEQTQDEASRVKTIYDELLRTIGYAFDEWRLRESDVVQRLSAALGTVLGLLGVVTVLDATMNLKPDGDDVTVLGGGVGWQQAGVWASWGLGGFVLLTVARLFYVWLRSGRLGSRRFRRHYASWFVASPRRGGVWRLLKDISTDGLERLVDECGMDTAAFARHDHQLAARFAALWDQAATMDRMDRSNIRYLDISAQGRRIEKWGLHTLLLTERAMRMHTHILPMLTCLYRSCTRIPGSSLGRPSRPGSTAAFGLSTTAPYPQSLRTMIDFNEFALSLAQIGLSRGQAHQLERWLLHRQPQTARHLVAILTYLGLSADMTPEAIDTMLTRIRTDLAAASLPEYPAAFAGDAREHLAHSGYTDWGATTPALCRFDEQDIVVHVLTDRAPTYRDVLELYREWLRSRRSAAHLVATHRIGRRATVLAHALGVRLVPLGWEAAPDERPAGESSRSRRR